MKKHFKKEVVMVTGASGYIGQHVVRAINAKLPDMEVVGVDLPDSNHWDWDWGFNLVDRNAVDFAVGEIRPSIVVHLAALALVEEAERQVGIYYNVNVQGTINLVEALTRVGCKHLIFASSAAARTRSGVYGWTKWLGEQVLEAPFSIPSTALRFFNVAGNQHKSTTHAVPNIARSLRTKQPFKVTADPLATIRDFIHVEDVAEAVVAFVSMNKQNIDQRFDIGTGKGTTLGDLIATFEQITGERLNVQRDKDRQGDPTELVAFFGDMPAATLWKPKRDLVDIVHSALAAEGWDRSTGRWFA